MRLRLLILSLFPSLAFAGPLADSLGISEALGDAKEAALTVGSVVILFAVFLSVIPIIIKLVKMADPRSAMLDQARVSFDGYKKYTTTPSARYGTSYKRQSYENHVVDSLYTHAEFLEFSARLREREIEWLKSQKEEMDVTDIETDISVAEQRMSTAEEELEEVRSQIEFYEQYRELDIEDAEIVDDSQDCDESCESDEPIWSSVEELDDRERPY